MIIIFWYVLSLIVNNITSKSFQLEYSQLSDSFNLIVLIGEPYRSKYFEIDLKEPVSWVTKAYYKRNDNVKVIGSDSIVIGHSQKTDYEIITDRLRVNNTKIDIEAFPLYYTIEFLQDFDGISFARKFKDDSYSFIHRLYQDKFIDKLAYGFFPIDSQKGKINFGTLSETINFKYKTSCNAYNTDSSWGCHLTKVYFGNEEHYYMNNHKMYFQASDKRILVPKDFMAVLNQTYFNKYMEKGICSLLIGFGRHTYECLPEVKHSFPNLTLEFDSITIDLPLKDIINDEVRNIKFYLEENYFNEDEWVFGLTFFTKYPVYFDYEKNDITFFSDVPFSAIASRKDSYNSSNPTALKVLIIVIMIQMSMSVVLIINKYK